MSQTLTTIEKALKENYLPAWNNQLGIEPTALLGKIKKQSAKSDIIVAAATVGLSGGFGFGAEGAATPASGNVRVQNFKTRTKDMYVNVVISQKAVKLASGGGSIIDALQTEIDGAYKTAKWNVGRSLFGDGTGKLANVTGKSGTTAPVLTVNDTSKLKEGLIIDVYDITGSDPATLTNGTGRRIASVDKANNQITLETGGSIGSWSSSAVDGVYGFVTVQNSYEREITGLGAIFDDNIATLYGVTKSTNPFIKPVVVDAGHDLDETVLTNALMEAEDEKNSFVDTLLCGKNAYNQYVNYLRVNNVRVEEVSHTLKGGFKAIKFIVGSREVDVVYEKFVPTNEIWGVDSKTLTLYSTDWTFAELQGGGIFNLMEGKSVYRALLTNYGELICSNPGGCVRITNCA